MNKLQQKLKKTVRQARIKLLPVKFEMNEIRIKVRMLKEKLPQPPQKWQQLKKERAIDKSLRQLVARAAWPKSTMETYYQKEALPLAGNDAGLKSYMVRRALRTLPKVARKGHAAHDFFAGLLETARKDSFWLKCDFVVGGVEILPALMKADPALTEKVVKGLIEIAGDNKDLKSRVYNAVIDMLPMAAKHDFRLKPVMPALINTLRLAAGDDLKQPVVYKELAVSPANPVSGHAALIVSMGEQWWKESYVSAGCFTGLASDFAKAAWKKYPDPASPGRVHYDAVIDFVRNAFDIMSVQPSLRDAVKAKINAAAPVTGTAWPAKKNP